jgi:glutamyl-Q tRNA(Asp) synthetase
MIARAYRGRFAPTPSGPLHLGSLLTALASYLQARAAGGAWLLRIDDLDCQRSRPEHTSAILRQLEAHAMTWDETPRLQSAHRQEYEAAFERLRNGGMLYLCTCTRARLARESAMGCDGRVYSGRCRDLRVTAPRTAWRLRLAPGRLELIDRWQGRLVRECERDLGDFVVKRADGVIGYQLACVIDEAAQGITEVVRGADLIGSSFRQQCLQRALGLSSPAYAHLPLLVGGDGRKLSKQNHATALDSARASDNLGLCLGALQHSPPAELRGAPARTLVEWARQHWNPDRVPRRQHLPLHELTAASRPTPGVAGVHSPA